MMCLTEQKTERLIKLSKKDLMIMLEPYTDDSLICIGLQMQQGYVGFFDLEQDTKHKDKYEFVLNSDCFNEWYKKDIAELKEKIGEQQATNDYLEESNSRLQVQLGKTLRLVDKIKEENEQLKQQSSEKQEHITHLESKIHRMREQIHKLEKLYHYRSADIKRENEQLRQELQEKQEEEQLYANEILELREANKQFLRFKELGGDY